LRQPILYAEQMWRKQRLWVLFLVVIGVAMSGFLLLRPHRVFDPNTLIWVAYIPSGLLLLGALLYYRRRSHVEPLEEGLRVSNLLSHVVIDYAMIRSVKVQPLSQHFLDSRKRMIRPIGRPLMDRPALFIRLRGDDGELAAIRKKLGSQLVADDTIALPVPDPDAIAWDLNGRLPERAGVNLGGGRRGKRRR